MLRRLGLVKDVMTEFVPRSFAVYEDMSNWQETLAGFLSERGHKVSILEGDRSGALATITTANYRKKNIFAALVDGQLEDGPRGSVDGTILLEAIMALNLGVHVISVAGTPLVRAEFAFDKSRVVEELDRLEVYLSKIGA